MSRKRGGNGAKPRAVCWWLVEAGGATHDDNDDDMFPGSGAVTQAWNDWGVSILGEPEQLVMAHD